MMKLARTANSNSTFAIGGVLCSAGSFVVIGSSPDSYRDQMNICAQKPAYRKSANRNKNPSVPGSAGAKMSNPL